MLVVVVAIAVCGGLISRTDKTTPREYYEGYLETCKSGYTDAVDFVYFDNDWEAEFYVGNPMNKLLEYTIIDEQQINDSLVAFEVEFESAADRNLGQTVTAYNFVGIVDGEYKVMTNARNIPESLRENFDEDDFAITNDDSQLSIDDIVL